MQCFRDLTESWRQHRVCRRKLSSTSTRSSNRDRTDITGEQSLSVVCRSLSVGDTCSDQIEARDLPSFMQGFSDSLAVERHDVFLKETLSRESHQRIATRKLITSRQSGEGARLDKAGKGPES